MKLKIFSNIFPNILAQFLNIFFFVSLVNCQEYVNEKSENLTLIVKIKEHDIKFQLQSTKNITLTIQGNCPENTTLFFDHVKGEHSLIDNISDIILHGSNINQTEFITLKAIYVGHSTIYVNTTDNMSDISQAFTHLAVSYSSGLDVFSDIVGWGYFLAWSLSFYPQIYLNWKRKSVIGLHFDFLSLNLIGFFVYSVFNIGLFWIPSVQRQYFSRHMFGLNPVQLNDVIFSIHACAACFVQVIQCVLYERGNQRISNTAKWILGLIGVLSILMMILTISNVIIWLDYLYFLSYVKLFITLIKYIPQAYYNYQRKSTSGWSIGNVLGDFTGGALSIAQMFILAYNYDDWGSIFGDPTKFGLGLFSILFDTFFIIQHYVLYKNHNDYIPVSHVDPKMTDSTHSSNNYGAVESMPT